MFSIFRSFTSRWKRRNPSDHFVSSTDCTEEFTRDVQTRNWQAVLTASIDQLCEAPSADTVRYACDLFAEEVYAPFVERDARMAMLLADIRSGFAELVARAPGLFEAALAQHPQVFADLRRLQIGGR